MRDGHGSARPSPAPSHRPWRGASRRERPGTSRRSPRLVSGPPAGARRATATATPLQRDRGRIVTASFRRLRHKTQVFVAPEGDHFRTRLTHTLEVTQISRAVARGLGLNEDPSRRSASATTSATRRSGTSGRTSTGAGRSASAAASATTSTRAGRRRARARRPGLNLTDDVRNGIVCHSGGAPLARYAQGPASGSSIASPTSTTISTTRSARACSTRRSFRRADRGARRPGSRGSTHSSTTSSSARRVAGDIVQGEEPGAAMDALRDFMFERVYLGAGRPARAREDRAGACRRSSTTTASTRGDARAAASPAPTRRSGSPTTSPE